LTNKILAKRSSVSSSVPSSLDAGEIAVNTNVGDGGKFFIGL